MLTIHLKSKPFWKQAAATSNTSKLLKSSVLRYNIDETQRRSESKLKVEFVDNIANSIEGLKAFCVTNIERAEGSLSVKVINLEEDNKGMSEKIVGIENFSMIQEDKAKFVESPTSRVNKMDEMRQESYVKTR